MKLTLYPLSLPGKVYRSPMPFSLRYDLDETIYAEYIAANINVVVLLVGDQEIAAKGRAGLRVLYEADGIRVIQLPIEDYDIPTLTALNAAVAEVEVAASKGQNIVIHCHAGIGRTGLFAACLVGKVLHLNAQEAIKWVRNFHPAVETDSQVIMVEAFLALQN